MDAVQLVKELALKARKASRTLATASGAERKAALELIAEEIEARSAEILAANELDMASARAENMHPQMQDRLLLTADRIKGISGGARQVAAMPDPLGQTLRKSTLPNGHHRLPIERKAEA